MIDLWDPIDEEEELDDPPLSRRGGARPRGTGGPTAPFGGAMRRARRLVIHCSDSPFGDAETIRRWHRAQGWRDIGYNAVILNGRTTPKTYDASLDGVLQVGRGLNFDDLISPEEVGAHTLGYNADSVGVCLIGIDAFTPRQWWTLRSFCEIWLAIRPGLEIVGHRDLDRRKTCPNFDVLGWRETLGFVPD